MKDRAVEALATRCAELLRVIGLIDARDAVVEVRPLTGGVSSDIARVAIRRGPGDPRPAAVCVKFALPKLRVEADWRVPVRRNAAEYAWLGYAAAAAPGAAPAPLGRDAAHDGFAMEAVEGDGVRLWKADLLAGRSDGAEVVTVAGALGRLHAASTGPDFDRTAFDNHEDFHAIRIDPYLIATARAHPGLADPMHAMAERLDAADAVLIHGDVSPKNVLLRGGSPVLLDAECASMGDPAFDLAFLLNHIVLKAVHLRDPRLLDAALAGAGAYARFVDWEAADALEARVAALLPMLMLARVDGKSPVEYLTEPTREAVRRLAGMAILAPRDRLAVLLGDVRRGIEVSI